MPPRPAPDWSPVAPVLLWVGLLVVLVEDGTLVDAGLAPSGCFITAWKVYPSESLRVSRGV